MIKHLAHEERLPISQILENIAKNWDEETITLNGLMDYLGDRSYGLMIVLLAVPNLLPVSVPGISIILGIVIMSMCTQMWRNYEHPILPKIVADKEVPFEPFAQVIYRSLPIFRFAEKLLKPRHSFMFSRKAEKIIALVIFFAAFTMMLPVPLGNPPPASCLILLALGLIEKDGIFVYIGCVATVLSTILLTFMSWGAIMGLWIVLENILEIS